ncbi:malonic semialdehyde reductase [Erythrobacteraceae bacterium CFH 75059]|uniref:malonic semialdehyde reductase n=1 Tax=Qipengyuania thermophila TaxID=2509361 RepID=UPI001020E715|nr:malonic semialdehyde reductase [Qipengyuania thermophila]TCD02247.1 malonic semialdehyde reductase [Erythrobacteraceae bacterium CFH 75059]
MKQYHDRPVDDAVLDQLFLEARSYNGWLDRPVSEAQIRRLYDLMKMGPTSANMQPSRLVWCVSPEARERLARHAIESNRAKIVTAPVCVVIGFDRDFHEQLPWLFPHTDARSWFADDPDGRVVGARRNSALQGAYLMLAARALGMDCGPMSGVDLDGVTREFYADQPRVEADWICSIGYGDPASVFGRSPRPEFERFNRVL